MKKNPPTITTAPTGQIAPFGLRMLPELRARIEEAARVSGRSMNAEIVSRLESSFQASPSVSLKARMQIALMESRVATVRANRAIEELRVEALGNRLQMLKNAKSAAQTLDAQVLIEQLDAAKAAEEALRAEHDKLWAELCGSRSEDSPTKDSDID